MGRRPGDGTWTVLAGGGTGGHLYPGIAVATALVEMGHDPATLRFVGARRGLEASTKELDRFPVTLLPGRGLLRHFSARNLLANIGALTEVARATGTAIWLFRRWRPSVVVCLGGYASLPCVAAAVIWRAPVVVVNVDAVPGLVNRATARLAAACAVSTSDAGLPRQHVTGVPVRPRMEVIDRSPQARRQARLALGLPEDARTIAVCGGSLGARRLNQATAELARAWQQRTGTAVRHVVGRRDWEDRSLRVAAPASPGLVYQQVPYEEDMAALYAAADVAVQRAGASTVAELGLAGVPSLLVPLPGAPGDHQGANARMMAGVGGAVVLADDKLDGACLARELDALLDNPARLAAMGEAARSLGRPGAARAIAELVQQVARPPMCPPGDTANRTSKDGLP